MPRIKFKQGEQRQFLLAAGKKLERNGLQIAGLVGAHRRTVNGWLLEHFNMPETALRILERKSGIKASQSNYTLLPDYWSASKAGRKAGLLNYQRYGNPGTAEGRRKGGQHSQELRRMYPERYSHCNIRKEITHPRNHASLAEFVGIVLGDGSMQSAYQVVITLHKRDHKQYVDYVTRLIQGLFGIEAAVYKYRSERSRNVVGITISGAAVVEFLISKGLRRGDKVKNQADVPTWIKRNHQLSKACLRGLIDTDGCVYSHRHSTHGHTYYNIGMTFTNHSVPMLRFVHKTLQNCGFSAKIQGSHGVFLYREDEVVRYAKTVSFANTHHQDRLERFLKERDYFRRGEVA